MVGDSGGDRRRHHHQHSLPSIIIHHRINRHHQCHITSHLIAIINTTGPLEPLHDCLPTKSTLPDYVKGHPLATFRMHLSQYDGSKQATQELLSLLVQGANSLVVLPQKREVVKHVNCEHFKHSRVYMSILEVKWAMLRNNDENVANYF